MNKEKVKFFIASIAWRVYLWAMGLTEAELIADLQETALAEYKSEKANAWLMK